MSRREKLGEENGQCKWCCANHGEGGGCCQEGTTQLTLPQQPGPAAASLLPVALPDTALRSHVVISMQMNQDLSNCFLKQREVITVQGFVYLAKSVCWKCYKYPQLNLQSLSLYSMTPINSAVTQDTERKISDRSPTLVCTEQGCP